jgi:hypothetical protein
LYKEGDNFNDLCDNLRLNEDTGISDEFLKRCYFIIRVSDPDDKEKNNQEIAKL